MNPIKSVTTNTSTATGAGNRSERKRVADSSSPKGAKSIVGSYTKAILYDTLVAKTGLAKADPALAKGLQMFQTAYEQEVEESLKLSPEGHLQEASKYGSFKEYYDAQWAPEKVSARIINFSISRFESWYTRHQEMGRDEALDKFAKIMTQAVQKGYDKAMGILGDVPKETHAELEKTLKLSKEGIESWSTDQQAPPAETETARMGETKVEI